MSSAHAARATETRVPFLMCLFSFPVRGRAVQSLHERGLLQRQGLCCGGSPCVPGAWHRTGSWMGPINTC